MKHAHVIMHRSSHGGNVCVCTLKSVGELGQKCQLSLLPGPWTTTVWQSDQLGVSLCAVCCMYVRRQERQQHCNVGSIGPGSRGRGRKQDEGALAVFGVASSTKLFPIESLPASRHDPLPRIAPPACLSGPP